MRKAIVALLVTTFATFGIAAEPETPGSAGPQAYAETLRNARINQTGRTATLNLPSQPAAQAAGDRGAQDAAEASHMKKMHGAINQSADQRLEMDHPNH